MANEINVWNKVMSSALAIPGVQVDREVLKSRTSSILLKTGFGEGNM